MDRRQLLEHLVNDPLAMAVLHDRRHFELVPERVAACGYGTAAEPRLLVVGDGLLVSLTLTPANDDERARIVVDVEPLDRQQGAVRLEQLHIDDAISIRRRRWTIAVNGRAEPLVIETEQRRGALFPDELRPTPAEGVARALARQLGYEVTDD